MHGLRARGTIRGMPKLGDKARTPCPARDSRTMVYRQTHYEDNSAGQDFRARAEVLGGWHCTS